MASFAVRASVGGGSNPLSNRKMIGKTNKEESNQLPENQIMAAVKKYREICVLLHLLVMLPRHFTRQTAKNYAIFSL